MEVTLDFLKAISDKNRLIILFILSKHTLCVCDLHQIIPITQGALSIQLRSLSKLNLLSSHKQGKWVFYKLSERIKESHKSILSTIFKDIKHEKCVTEAMANLTISEICKY